MTNCVNCGAPLHGNICEYCGTEYGQNHSETNSDKENNEEIFIWTDCNGITHRSVIIVSNT